MDAIEAIHARRSVGRLGPPAPTPEHLTTLLEAAAAAPDHGRLRPWRFVVLEGAEKDDFGAVLAEAYERRCAADGTDPDPSLLDKERTKLGRAPMVVVVAASVDESVAKVPAVEQVLAAGAATQNLLLAATALGYGSMWRTGEPAYDSHVKRALGLRDQDAIVAFVYLGTPP